MIKYAYSTCRTCLQERIAAYAPAIACMRRCDATDRQHDASMTKCNQPAETTPSQAPTADADADADAACGCRCCGCCWRRRRGRGGQKSLEEDDEVRRAWCWRTVRTGFQLSRAHIWVTRTILRCHTGRALLVVFTRCPESLTCITDPR